METTTLRRFLALHQHRKLRVRLVESSWHTFELLGFVTDFDDQALVIETAPGFATLLLLTAVVGVRLDEEDPDAPR